MIFGRVIGNELRDVPPECLPIWGQRWSGSRAPHGPSPFSTRIFSVDRMSEMGPALTSPSQFEATLTEEDEGEDTSSESSRFHGYFPSSPLAIQPGAAELISLPETPMLRSDRRSSSHSHGSPETLHWSTGHSPPQNSTCFNAMFFTRRRSEELGVQYHASQSLFHPPSFHHGISVQGGCESFENDYTLWDMDRTSASIQPQANPPHGSHVPTRQLRHTMPRNPSLEWQFTSAHTQPPAYSFQPNPSSHPGGSYLLRPFQADDRTRFTPLPPSHCFTIPSPQQSVGIDSSWNHDSGITLVSSIAHPPNPIIPQWPSGPTSSNSSFPGPLQNPGLLLGTGGFYHLASDYHRNAPHPEELLGTSTYAKRCTLSSLDKTRK